MRAAILAALSLASLSCARTAPSAPTAAPAAARACVPSAPGTSSFELVVLGSGGPTAFGRAASGYAVLVDGVARALVDVGPGAFVRLGEMGIDGHRLDTIFLTHLHIDHSGDLPGFVKSRDLTNDERLSFRIYGPSGAGVYPATTAFIDRLFGAQGAFAYLATFRNRMDLVAVDLPIALDAPIHDVVRGGDLHVTSIAVDHDDAPAVAFRIEHAGRALVVSGDLASKNDNLVRLAEGADLLVYDTSVLDPPRSPAKLYDLHTTPARIGVVATRSHARALLLSHIRPTSRSRKTRFFGRCRPAITGRLDSRATACASPSRSSTPLSSEPNKSAFVRSLPADMPAKDVVRSALYSSSRRAVIGLVNTGLENEPIGSGPDAAALRPACAADRPCEIDADGGARLVEANYAVDLRSLAGCFDATGVFAATGPTCGLPRSGP